MGLQQFVRVGDHKRRQLMLLRLILKTDFCLSGFVDEQEEWVIKSHTDLGLKLIKIYKLDNWRAALLEKQ